MTVQQNAAASARPQLVAARSTGRSVLDDAISATSQRGGIDIDLLHAMDRADDRLVADEILHGSMSGSFVYSFAISGKTTTGISVVGAKHLARQYGGLKHRIIASVEKRGALHIFRSYPDEGRPMQVTTSVLHELGDEDDYFTSVVEISCIKTGNAFQAEKTELRHEKRRDGSKYDRPNFQTIAQSKAYRNAVLALVPQDVQARFKAECLRLGNSADITDSAIDAKRSGIVAFAAKNGIPVIRDALSELDWNQISGLSEAARAGLPAFVNAGKSLGLIADFDPATGEVLEPEPVRRAAAPAAKAAAGKPAPAAAKPAPEPDYSAPGSLAADDDDFPT